MNVTINLMLTTLLLLCSSVYSQEEPAEKPSNEVEKTNKKIDEANDSFNRTLDDTKKTIDGVSETFESIFGSGKKNKTKTKKGVVQIVIPNVNFDDAKLGELYQSLSKVKGVKKLKKTFKKNTALFELNFKKGAGNLWDAIAAKPKSNFNINEITDTMISLQLKTIKQ